MGWMWVERSPCSNHEHGRIRPGNHKPTDPHRQYIIVSIVGISSNRTEERLLVVLRDGRNLFGILRSYDQFGME